MCRLVIRMSDEDIVAHAGDRREGLCVSGGVASGNAVSNVMTLGSARNFRKVQQGTTRSRELPILDGIAFRDFL